MTTLTHRERMQACLRGEILPSAPVALWRHFPVDDQTSDGLARITAAFQHTYDFDFIKVTPSSSFCLKDWGVEDRWAGNPEGTRDYTRRAIQKPQDWARLPVLDPRRGKLSDQITCLRLLTGEFSAHTPVLQTVFSPMSQAKNLVGGAQLLVHLRQHPEAVHAGLEIITQTTLRFLEESIATGIDGIFYAVQHAQYGLLSEPEFAEFGQAYDLRILAAAQSLWLNLIHLHGSAVMFDVVAHYPPAILNWHDRETSPSLAEARAKCSNVLCGGLRQWDSMVLGTPEQVYAEAQDAIQQTDGQRFILGTGCVLPVTAPNANIQAAIRAAQSWQKE